MNTGKRGTWTWSLDEEVVDATYADHVEIAWFEVQGWDTSSWKERCDDPKIDWTRHYGVLQYRGGVYHSRGNQEKRYRGWRILMKNQHTQSTATLISGDNERAETIDREEFELFHRWARHWTDVPQVWQVEEKHVPRLATQRGKLLTCWQSTTMPRMRAAYSQWA